MSAWLKRTKGSDPQVTTIVILAMLFAVLALRLYAILGRRTGQEPRQLPASIDDRTVQERAPVPPSGDQRPGVAQLGESLVSPSAQSGLRSLIAEDRTFDVTQFLGGARAAYGMILDAFWKGDREMLRQYCDADVLAGFEKAIDDRETAGHTLANRLVRIDTSLIDDIEVVSGAARIAVRFEADIAAVTRDKDGAMVAGSLDDAITTKDIWTFSRDVRSRDPNWLLTETDEG